MNNNFEHPSHILNRIENCPSISGKYANLKVNNPELADEEMENFICVNIFDKMKEVLYKYGYVCQKDVLLNEMANQIPDIDNSWIDKVLAKYNKYLDVNVNGFVAKTNESFPPNCYLF